ncbi:MAG TPA: ATP-grasp domain-containing protein [Candidatus Angelobacter sp.]|nr:ATP-grasp domain-containing protein [Candidatus Angelobacter sp.]
MSEMTVLVLDGHSRAALETLQSLGRAGLQMDLAAEAKHCLSMHSRYATRKLQQPTQEKVADFHAWLRAEDKIRNYALIVPATETSLLGLRQLSAHDPLRRKAVIPSDKALDTALDKERTWQLAQKMGVPVPASVLISSFPEIGEVKQFPVVLKPSHSKVMIGGELRTLAVAMVRSESERQEHLRRWIPLTPVQQQQYISGRGIGVEFLFNQGRKIWHFAHERLHEYPLTGGASSYRRSIDPPAAMLRDAEKLLTALQWHGVAMVEFKMDAGGQYWLMEINPRLWGSLALSIDAGVDFPLGLLQIARGNEPAPQPRYKIAYYTRDLRTDMDWLKSNQRANRQDPLLHTCSRAFSLLELLRPLGGRESWDHFDWHDLGVTGRTLASAASDQLRPVFRKIKNWRIQRSLLRRHRTLLHRLAGSDAPSKIVFLCYGNICRSPLAAGLAKQAVSGIAIDSAGFHEHVGRRCPEKIQRTANSFGIDLSAHRSARLTQDHLVDADLVIVMDLENLDRLRKEFPTIVDRTTLLGLFGKQRTLAIPDPYPAEETAARVICDQVRDGVQGLAVWVAKLKNATCTPAVPFTATGSR